MWETKNISSDTLTLLTVLFLIIYIHPRGSSFHQYDSDSVIEESI